MTSIEPTPQSKAKTLAQRIAQLVDPIHIGEVAQDSAVFNEYEVAKELLAKWKNSDPRGTPTEIEFRDDKLANAQQNFDAVEAKLRTLRGDYGGMDQTDSPRSVSGGSLPTPLTTSDIAHIFSGLRWTSATAWKKPLADKPKWLLGCVAIPGSRGRSETRWNPVLIGAALVHHGHVPVNRVRAKFQTQPLLQPWQEAWKSYEATNFGDQ